MFCIYNSIYSYVYSTILHAYEINLSNVRGYAKILKNPKFKRFLSFVMFGKSTGNVKQIIGNIQGMLAK